MKKFMRKLLAVTLAAGITLTSLPFVASAATVSDFTDVKPGSWYYNAVQYAVDNSLFSGTGDTTFSPEQGMTRGMFVTVLGRKNGMDVSAYGDVRFSDVKAKDYFAPYVEWAAANGIVSGTSDTTFDPNARITREQMAAILYRYAQKTGNDTSFTDGATYMFRDDGLISGYALEAMDWAVTHGIVNGSDKKLNPKDTATRAQVAQVFLGCKDILVNTELTDTPDVPEGQLLTNGKPATPENVTEAIYALQGKYPEGMEWGDSNGESCVSFVDKIWWAVFRMQEQDEATENPAVFDNLRPGDHVRYSNETTNAHSVVVLEKYNDYVVIVEGNYNGTVHWGREITRTEWENSRKFVRYYCY